MALVRRNGVPIIVVAAPIRNEGALLHQGVKKGPQFEHVSEVTVLSDIQKQCLEFQTTIANILLCNFVFAQKAS